MKVKVKKLDLEAITPSYAHPGDAALDIFSLEDYTLKPGERYSFRTGVAFELPEGYAALVWDKSGLSVNHGLKMMAGVIDPHYRGELRITLLNTSDEPYEFKKGNKLANVVIQKVENAEVEVVKELSKTKRGEGGFGSTGR